MAKTIADLRAQLAEAKRYQEVNAKAYVECANRLSAATQRLEEAEKQEPYGYCDIDGKLEPIYTRPSPPADVAELQRKFDESVNAQNELHEEIYTYQQRIAELERKLAEQQAIWVTVMQVNLQLEPTSGCEELAKLLSEARSLNAKEGVE